MPNRNTPTDGASAWPAFTLRRLAILYLAAALSGVVALGALPQVARAADPAPGAATPDAAASPAASPVADPTPTPPPSPTPAPSPSPTPTPTPPPTAPVAAIRTLPSSVLATLPFTFGDASKGTIASRRWDFGDGTHLTTTATSVSHTFAHGGTFSVRLTVSGAAGTDSATAAVTVAQPYVIDLYRSSAYVRQFTNTWCVGAAVQMMTNIARHVASHTKARQRNLMRMARAHDTLPASRPGSDPRGWAWTLRRVGAGATYQHLNFSSRTAALEYAARRLQAFRKPVGLLAWNGAHAWIMTGFVAWSDPSTTGDPVVAAVIVSGPLGSPRDPIDRVMTIPALARYFGPYLQRDGWLGWVGKYVVVAP